MPDRKGGKEGWKREIKKKRTKGGNEKKVGKETERSREEGSRGRKRR